MGSRLGRRVIHFTNLPIKLLMPSPPFDRIHEIALKTIPSASKIDICRVLESLYDFDAEAVRTLNMEGKKKKRGGFLSATPDYKKAYVTLRHLLSLNLDLFPVRIVQEEREKIAQASASRPAVVEGSGKHSHWLDDPDRGLDRRDLPHGPKKGRSGVRRIGGGRGFPVKMAEESKFPWSNMRAAGRSGRTGRAGNTGVAIRLYEPGFSHDISKIERESGFKFEHISAPQPADVAESVGSEAASPISDVSDSVIPVFRLQAEQLLISFGMPALDLLAKAHAKAAGYTDIKKRSLLSSMENCVTLLLQTGRSIYTPSLAFSTLRRFLPDEKIEGVKGLSLTADGMGAVFDVPADDVNVFLEGQENASMVTLEVLDKLPPLQNKEDTRGNNSGRGRFGRGGGSRFSGGRGGSGGGFSGRGGRGRGGGGRFSRRN